MIQNDVHLESGDEPRCPGFVTALVLRCGQGDEAALTSLMELLYAPVCARLSVTALPGDEAEEVVARAFIHIWHRAAAYAAAPRGDVIAWLLDEAEASLDATELVAS